MNYHGFIVQFAFCKWYMIATWAKILRCVNNCVINSFECYMHWFILFIGLIVSTQSCFAETWQSVLEAKFDRVDTFDHYDDWTPINTTWSGPSNHKDLPVSTNGKPKGLKIGFYDFPSNLPNERRPVSITSWGASYVSRGEGKSMVIGSNGVPSDDAYGSWYGTDTYKGHRGPNWVKVYFGEEGNTDGTSGYSECYVYPASFIFAKNE